MIGGIGMDPVIIGCFAAVLAAVLVLLWGIRMNCNSIRSIEERLSGLSSPVRSTAKAEPPEDGIPPEVIAAISAAVACIYPGAQLHSLRRMPEKTRSAWQTAGLLENTRPF